MTEPMTRVALGVVQTDQGLKLAQAPSEGIARSDVEPVTEWANHIYVPRLFYLWAVDNSEKKVSSWVQADTGRLEFQLEGTWARYEIAHPADDGHHYNLIDSGEAVV